jgi:regulator of PEP synthase PpsR (kinase-PPPase family)
LVVALTRDPKSLSQIRQSRLSVLGQTSAMAFDAAKRGGHNYAEYETVRDEVAAAKRLFLKHGWPIIDVTRKSIEEAAAKILTLLQKHQAEQAAHRAHEEGTQNGRTA